MKTYKIVRHYYHGIPRTVRTGLTLEQAQAHCSDPETSSSTCKSASAKARSWRVGKWFDGYTEEKS